MNGEPGPSSAESPREIFDRSPGVERLSSGLEIIRRQHQLTGQILVAIGAGHVHEPESDEISGVTHEVEDFLVRTPDGPRQFFVEGRVPAVIHQGQLYPGERLPAVNTENKAAAVQMYGPAGLLACMGAENGVNVQSGDNDRKIILQLAADGFAREDILRYLLFRQFPDWTRIDDSHRPPLGDYLQQNVVDRYGKMLEDTWSNVGESIHELMDIRQTTLNHVSMLPPEEVEYFLSETVGHMFEGPSNTTTTKPSVTRQVSIAYNRLRDNHFAHLATEDWGNPGTPHKLIQVDVPHLETIAPALLRL
jgi:hypothetical protein